MRQSQRNLWWLRFLSLKMSERMRMQRRKKKKKLILKQLIEPTNSFGLNLIIRIIIISSKVSNKEQLINVITLAYSFRRKKGLLIESDHATDSATGVGECVTLTSLILLVISAKLSTCGFSLGAADEDWLLFLR